MPNWGEVLKDIQSTPNPLDTQRRRYLANMEKYTGRNVIAYYSGFLQKDNSYAMAINDNDKNGFMQAVHRLDKSKGLDLVIHTPGGDLAAVESIVSYLKMVFGNDIRAIVPQIAMSAGTMIALACKEIVMGKHSNLGPIDPQFGGLSCAAVLEEFETACEEIKRDPSRIPMWTPIIQNYHPTFLGMCQNAIDWGIEMVKKWLMDNMLADRTEKEGLAKNIVDELSSPRRTKSHARHIHIEECRNLGIKVTALETLGPKKRIDNCQDLQDCVLTLHHSYMHTFTHSNALKIIENHLGTAMILQQK